MLEVLIAVVIFALGLLAFLQLQGGLARSSADANQRTVAVNIAEEILERRRGFGRLSTDPDGVIPAYADIVGGTTTYTRGGIEYSVTTEVDDYYYANGGFTTTAPTGRALSDFKLVTLTVDWGGDSGTEFRIDDNSRATLGSGSVRLTDVIASTTSVGGSRALTAGDLNLTGPEVQYTPGSQPDVISISLGNNRFKESTIPVPEVTRQQELVETTFDVVTYSQLNQDASFIRREEFRAVSCECTLRVPATSAQGGHRPTVWTGAEYEIGEYVSKTYGVSASNQQSVMCDVCCRDHHDGGTGEDDDPEDPGRAKYDPFKTADEYWAEGALVGDHKHYTRSATGGLTIADSDGDHYVEACRLVRKDGFFKVAQDLRAEVVHDFPSSWFESDTNVDKYSSFVTGGASAYEEEVGSTNGYESSPPTFWQPDNLAVTFPGMLAPYATNLPDPNGAKARQMQSRGVFIDYLSDELRLAINCLDIWGDGDECGTPGVASALEIMPFYDVQLTWLARWTETPNNHPVDVSNEAIETGNTHSRGVASMGDGTGYTVVNAAIHRGNLGLTGTDPVDPNYAVHVMGRNHYMRSYGSGTAPPMTSILVSGSITSAVGGVKAADVEISATDAQCDRTNTGYECVIESGASNPRLTISNYYKSNKILVGCSDVLVIHGAEIGNLNWTRFNLPLESHSSANIVIREDTCG